MNNLEIQVKKANKDFYDIVGADYEKIEGDMLPWLKLEQKNKKGYFL